jgi:hypothetical protein
MRSTKSQNLELFSERNVKKDLQKRVVRTKFDIYVFSNRPIFLLVP